MSWKFFFPLAGWNLSSSSRALQREYISVFVIKERWPSGGPGGADLVYIRKLPTGLWLENQGENEFVLLYFTSVLETCLHLCSILHNWKCLRSYVIRCNRCIIGYYKWFYQYVYCGTHMVLWLFTFWNTIIWQEVIQRDQTKVLNPNSSAGKNEVTDFEFYSYSTNIIIFFFGIFLCWGMQYMTEVNYSKTCNLKT